MSWIGSRAYDLAKGALPLAERLRSVSFAQYAEDTLLHHLNPQREGFYIDVGAYHPWDGSNTYKLYLRGWRGITLEPNPAIAPLFRRTRPRDTHLVFGVSDPASELPYHEFDDAKLNSFDKEQAERMQSRVRRATLVACRPLREIVAEHAGGTHIDLLSIDCEGLDFAVLQSLDWEVTRPCVVVIEDFEQFRLNVQGGGASHIQAFLKENGYAVLSQAMFSFLYLDTTACRRSVRSGFHIAQSQARIVAR